MLGCEQEMNRNYEKFCSCHGHHFSFMRTFRCLMTHMWLNIYQEPQSP